jgi:small subunit ribosomal protein S16
LLEPSSFVVDKEKTASWLSKGAEPTEKVRILLGKAGILPAIDLAALKKRKPKAEEKAEAKPKAEKPAGGVAEEKKAEKPKPPAEKKAEAKA